MLSWNHFLPSVVCALGLAGVASSQSMEASNGCATTGDDPCTRSGTCSIQQTTWSQSVVIDRADPYDTIGWAGL